MLGFKIDNKKIYLDDIDRIGEFFETGLDELTNKYEVYTSQKIKDTSIRCIFYPLSIYIN